MIFSRLLSFRLPDLATALCLVVLLPLTGQTWTIDPTFAPQIENRTTSSAPRVVAAPDGGFFVALAYDTPAEVASTSLNGSPTPRLLRLTADGNVDAGFVAALPDDFSIAKIVIAGPESTWVLLEPVTNVGVVNRTQGYPAGTTFPPYRLLRLGATGNVATTIEVTQITSRNPEFQTLLGQPDGRLIVQGNFTAIGDVARDHLARLNLDGTLDLTFTPPSTTDYAQLSLAPSGGLFARRTNPSDTIIKLAADGSIDASFTWPTNGLPRWMMAASFDGGLITAGEALIHRYNANGSLASSDNLARIGMVQIASIASLTDGGLAVTATATTQTPPSTSNPQIIGQGVVLLILNADGSVRFDSRKILPAPHRNSVLAVSAHGTALVYLRSALPYPAPPDSLLPANLQPSLALFSGQAITPLRLEFVSTLPGSVSALFEDAYGRILATGRFTHVDDVPRAGWARFLADGELDRTFNPPSGTLELALRSGAAIARITEVGPGNETLSLTTRERLVRLQADTGVAETIPVASRHDALTTRWLLEGPDGRLLIATLGGATAPNAATHLVWLDALGRENQVLPTTFSFIGIAASVEIASSRFPTTAVQSAQLLDDGRLLVAGGGISTGDVVEPRLARLTTTGYLDSAYRPTLPDAQFLEVTLAPGGTALVAAINFGGIKPWVSWTRLRADGSADPEFMPEPEAGFSTILSNGQSLSFGQVLDAFGWPDPTFARAANTAVSTGLLDRTGRLWTAQTSAVVVIGASVPAQAQSPLVRYLPPVASLSGIFPADVSAIAGETTSLAVDLGSDATAVQWLKNGQEIPGANRSRLIFRRVSPSDDGNYRAQVTINGQAVTSRTATLTVRPNTTRFTNVSARSLVTVNQPQFGGVSFTGTAPHVILIRAVGRGISDFNTSPFPPLAEPELSLYQNGVLQAHDIGSANNPAFRELSASVGAFPITVGPFNVSPGAIYGSAITTSLDPSSIHTTIVRSLNGESGVDLLEFYAGTAGSLASPMRNASLRARAGYGDETMIVGFVIRGEGPARVLIRALGPALTAFGIKAPLTDPALALFGSSGFALATNDNWSSSPHNAPAFAAAGAFPLPAGSADAALVRDLQPGVYTAQVTLPPGVPPGEALLEIYLVAP